ncbi:MAG: class I SAM-dependent rRNA methyltransferase [Planctomycetota bacterium]
MAKTLDAPIVGLNSDDVFPGPWVYARHVAAAPGVNDGDLVEVRDRSDRFLGHALFNGRSNIVLRWLHRGRKNDLARPADFLEAQLRRADQLRRKTLRLEATTDAYRMVHAEGDGLSGLIVDRLGDTLVVEYHALGFWRLKDEIEGALGRIYPGFRVLHRVPRVARKIEDFDPEVPPPADGRPVILTENEIRWELEPGDGHKTGWFADQRENRLRVAQLARGRRVLDLCTNLGGFALQAARAGARAVEAVDLDEKVLATAEATARANKLDVRFLHDDLFDRLRDAEERDEQWDIVILDPHKIVASKAALERGRRTYQDMNALAVGRVRPGGLFVTFSCSGAVERPAFYGWVFGAARRAERDVRLLASLEAGPDHPQDPAHPRSNYLKGALLAVDR